MEAEITALQRFYSKIDGEDRQKSYFRFNPAGAYTYLLYPSRDALIYLSERLRGDGLKRTLGSSAFRLSSYFPPVTTLVPQVSKIELCIKDGYSFDVAIIGTRITLLNLKTQRVIRIPLADETQIRQEIAVREQVEQFINVPQTYQYNESFPFVVEELITGRELRSVRCEWTVLLDALNQLSHWYRSQNSTSVPFDRFCTNLTHSLQEDEGYDETIRDALRLLEEVPVPDKLTRCTIHGDLHAGNVLTTGSGAYIVDWERAATGYPLNDFFRPFGVNYFDSREPGLVLDMVRGSGCGWEMATEYADAVGPTAYGSSKFYRGIPIICLLIQLDEIESDQTLWSAQYDLLSQVINEGI